MVSASTPPALLSIIALARAGAGEEAWRRLEAGGFSADDPAALTVRGRLLKDRAAAAPEADRKGLWRRAAEAYGRAGEIQGSATYPFINAATLSLLAGDAEASQARAGRVLELIERGEDGPETPYWRAATRAEALLLLGRTDEARATLGEAMATAPRAWEDHASTLRQFGLILAAQGADKGWLDALRPPRALHFAGHMGVGEDDGDLDARVRAVLAEENVGFGYGALGAGADIVIAEALLAHGAELHLVLPAEPERFAAASVAPFGGGWAARFEAVLGRAETVEAAAGGCGGAARQVAAEAAMGAAVMRAGLFETEAVQLVVLDQADGPAGLPGGSAWAAEAWRRGGRRQAVLTASRAGTAPRSASPGDEAAAVVLAEVRLETGVGDLAGLAGALDGVAMPVAPRWTGEGFALVFATPAAAARGLKALGEAAGGEGFRAGAWYGPMARTADPFGGGLLLVGEGQAMAGRIAAAAPPGAVLVAEALAQALAAGPADRPRTELVGDLGDAGVRLYALR